MEYKFMASVLFVKDIQASRKFYEGLLGQKVTADHGPNIGFEGGFAIWEAGHANQIVYGESKTDEQPLGRHNLELYFENTELDEVVKAFETANVSYVHKMREQPWGQRVLRVSDPDGHIVEVGEPMPVVILRRHAEGLDAETIAQRTSMPLEIVKMILDSQNK